MSGHPHAGGEIGDVNAVCLAEVGPSPRGWGNPTAAHTLKLSARAIPTRVGKSKGGVPVHRLHAGHPHAGGEIREAGVYVAHCCGPSPRGWGNPDPDDQHASARRAIPTRVGKSGDGEESAPGTTGHPHAGGEIAWSSGQRMS